MRLSDAQVAQVCARAGFRNSALIAAVAVALAESGGDTQAVNVNNDATRSRDRGLFQINSRWHPEVTDAQAFDPAANAAAAYRISAGGTSWSQWSTWKNGAATAQMVRARVAIARAGQAGTLTSSASPADYTLPGPDIPLPGPDIGPANPFGLDPFGFSDDGGGVLGDAGDLVDGITAPLDGIKQAVVLAVKAGAWLSDSHNWLRVAYVVGGTGGILIALAMIGKSGAAGDTAEGAVDLVGDAAILATTKGAGGAAKAGGAGAAAKAAT